MNVKHLMEVVTTPVLIFLEVSNVNVTVDMILVKMENLALVYNNI